jgi:hypothetical protein
MVINNPCIGSSSKKNTMHPGEISTIRKTFSTAEHTITNDRGRLLPELAEDIINLHDAWPLVD